MGIVILPNRVQQEIPSDGKLLQRSGAGSPDVLRQLQRMGHIQNLPRFTDDIRSMLQHDHVLQNHRRNDLVDNRTSKELAQVLIFTPRLDPYVARIGAIQREIAYAGKQLFEPLGDGELGKDGTAAHGKKTGDKLPLPIATVQR